MQHKTLISHFFNEEYLLPWWLNHHKKFFNDAILIDYNSTDNSCDIIKEICPNWKIIKTQNSHFDSRAIDLEVTEIEKSITGWRICLNTTEFLVGDYSIIDTLKNKKQLFISNFIFVDNTTNILDSNKSIYDQIFNGFHDNGYNSDIGLGGRSLRSLHNTYIRYPYKGGRHFFNKNSVNNLYIFYYGYLLGIEQIIQRKLQIQTKMSNQEIKTLSQYRHHPNIVTKDSFVSKILRYQFPKCKNIKSEIDKLVALQNNYLSINNIV